MRHLKLLVLLLYLTVMSAFLHAQCGALTINPLTGQLDCVSGGTNISIGGAGGSLTTGTDSFLAGKKAGKSLTTGSDTIAIGQMACSAETVENDLICIGFHAFEVYNQLGLNNGGESICIGAHCFENATNSPFVVAIGAHVAQYSTAANYTTAVGHGAMQFLSTGISNTTVGHHGNYQMTTGTQNVSMGQASLYSNNTGSNNVMIGWEADGFTPLNTFTLAASTGTGLSVGTYNYKIAYTLAGAITQLDAASQYSVTTTTGNQQVTISSIPAYTGPITCTNTSIYRSKLNDTSQSAYYLQGTTGNCTGTASYVDSTPDASLGATNSDPGGMIVFGSCGLYNGTAYKSNQFVVGCDTAPLTEMWVGRGVWSATPSDILVSATGGSGSNIAGANLILSGGPGTGTAASGSVLVKAAAAGSSGSTWNAVSEAARFTSTGLTLFSTRQKVPWAYPVQLSGQTASIGSTTITTAGSAGGIYLVSVYLNQDSNVTCSSFGSVTATVVWTDEGGNESFGSGSVSFQALASSAGIRTVTNSVWVKAAGTITYSTTYTAGSGCSGSGSTYRLSIAATEVQ